ncbi:RNA polymerase sigma factor sigE, chloroplastic/mitochondrial [Canna indica]|uniref:RNA polymerase sigma factor sigE, chloroplastic/mitochondrial n=1 Tax=Canna indica TaxID=4628 RepID=A0AAQ3PZR2_9LILI|nr:RNA polymerase sigma factor sigE, chloroplastic/mitochondrial [Canna indica]
MFHLEITANHENFPNFEWPANTLRVPWATRHARSLDVQTRLKYPSTNDHRPRVHYAIHVLFGSPKHISPPPQLFPLSPRLAPSAQSDPPLELFAPSDCVVSLTCVFPRYITVFLLHPPSCTPITGKQSLRLAVFPHRSSLTVVRSLAGRHQYLYLDMGVVTVPSSASRSPFGGGGGGLAIHHSPPLRRPFLFLAFKGGPGPKCSALVTPPESVTIPPEAVKEAKKSPGRAGKRSKRGKGVAVVAAPTTAPSSDACPCDPDYSEVAAALENIYKLSPADDVEAKGRKSAVKDGKVGVSNVVRNKKKRVKRLGLDERVTLRQRLKEEPGTKARRGEKREHDKDVQKLVREYFASTDLNGFDWKRMKMPPVLSSAEHTWLFKLIQPMKAILKVKEGLSEDFNREPTDAELADAVKMSVPQLRRHIEVGQAARNKLIKHNLRLVLFVINKYYPDIASGSKFQEFCQAGAKGLIVGIDRFEPKRGFCLSTYSFFWIRHSIIRSMTLSSFTKVPFGIESVRQEIQKAKLELSFELGRLPTDEEIVDRVGISLERYNDVMKASKQVISLNAKHIVTQEEFINAITDVDGVGGDKHRQSALLRLALDDVLDSLKPKESLVIRQRFGLDGKGNRSLGEIGGNLNISREMVRKYEMKALLKLKHPARVEYLRRYV